MRYSCSCTYQCLIGKSYNNDRQRLRENVDNYVGGFAGSADNLKLYLLSKNYLELVKIT